MGDDPQNIEKIREILSNIKDRMEAYESLKKLGLEDEKIAGIIENVFESE